MEFVLSGTGRDNSGFASHQYREQNEDRSRVSTRNSSGPVPGQGLMPFSDMERTVFCGDVDV